MVDGKIIERDTLPMSLSYDHRVVNGVYAVNFLNHLIKNLNDIKFLESSFK